MPDIDRQLVEADIDAGKVLRSVDHAPEPNAPEGTNSL